MFINISFFMKTLYRILRNAAADTFSVPVILSVLLGSVVSGLMIFIWFLTDTKEITYDISIAEIVLAVFVFIAVIFVISITIIFCFVLGYSISDHFYKKYKTKQSHQDTNS